MTSSASLLPTSLADVESSQTNGIAVAEQAHITPFIRFISLQQRRISRSVRLTSRNTLAQPFSHFACPAPSLPINKQDSSNHRSISHSSPPARLSDQQQSTPALQRSFLLARHNSRGQQCTCHHRPCKPALSPHRTASADSCSTRELAFPARPNSLWRSNTAIQRQLHNFSPCRQPHTTHCLNSARGVCMSFDIKHGQLPHSQISAHHRILPSVINATGKQLRP